MKNALIAVTALAGLFTQAAADQCRGGIDYCGKTIAAYSGYEFVIQQWYYDTTKRQPAKDYENNIYNCLANGALRYIGFCEYGCKTTPAGQDDECKPKDSNLVLVVAKHDCAEKPVLSVAKELRV